ncbi:TetR/AcrR family transcriptional regulator [Yoonia sp. I 8.24]|uniref:TetR/AcrR family transcriptional regulator n=1 Tax=Yoonia sp. I 8.24 TaxID=1537229 RepID=UPI001EE0BDA7|nr:TetR/AcrR family transcriptional regulator [Yoonia sp. I 8.24]MCG3268242.1 TetR/AcrR family transcriptional regulator [Yoonia sp. I 8.24]
MARTATYDREDLIKRAKTVFWKRGWAGTSLKDLEAALDTRPGSFYAAFGSKEALYKLTLNKYAQEGAEKIDALCVERGPLGALQAYPRILVEDPTMGGHACMLAKTFLELKGQDHALAEVANDLLVMIEKKFADLFRSAQVNGDVAVHYDPETLARRYQSDLLGLRVLAARAPGQAQDIARDMAAELGRLGPGVQSD